MFGVELEPQMVVACSEIALDLVENKIDLKVVRGTFEALSGSLIVMDTVVAYDWYWVEYGLVYRLVLETFVNGLMIDLAYRVVTEVGGWARNWVHFPLITFSMLLVLVICIYVQHYTPLHYFLR
jgi:hypothetical protein